MEPEQLPVSVSGPSEVGRLLHELEAIDSALLSQELREGQTATAPTMSGLMRSTVEANKFNLSHKEDRDRLGQFLRHVKQNAPLLHISFSADPPPNFMERLMTWLRREIDPHVLVTVGVQPTIAAGCIVRTTNKYFDFSLRQAFTDKRDTLLQQLHVRPTEVANHE